MKILVVEDDKNIAKFISRALQVDGYEVAVAYDGQNGLELALAGTFGLIILDVLLAKKDGLTLVRELRNKKYFTPVLILSGKDSVEDIVAGFDAGADDYLSKPFAFTELLARVQTLQRRTERDRGAKIHFSDLCLDPITHQVWRKEAELELTTKEYELLAYFMRNPNQVLTKNMIADEIWDGGFDKFTNVIAVYVNFLRGKIHKVGSRKLIHTVRGIGYVLKEEIDKDM